MKLDVEAVLSEHLEGYEPRPEQGRMVQEVWDTLKGAGHLIVEAGTGTGKSLAYLIPLAELTVTEETRAVVSTYTKALQRQLVEKDLPFIQEKICDPLRFALCLGSENYLCLRRLEQVKSHGFFTEDMDETGRLLEWAAATETGIREGKGDELWQKVAREGDMCLGRECREFTRCYYQRAKEKERSSHILVVNHHLYFANLASGRKALPPFETVVFDEAHELEDVAAGYMGVEISNFRFRHILNSILSSQGKGLISRLKWLTPSDFSNIASLVDVARTNAENFFLSVASCLGGQALRIREKHFHDDMVSEHLLRVKRELESLRDAVRDDEDRRELDASALRCEAAAGALKAILGQELEGHVYWAAKSGHAAVRIAATPVDVAGMNVFSDLTSVVFTSATLSTGGNFRYMRERLGLKRAGEILLESHFNYREQAAVYIANDLPAPNTEEYEKGAIRRIREILAITGGRTLVLFTSHSMLNTAADSIHMEGINILRQGEADSYRLVEEFKADPRSALFGTYTFWQGIDVPGEALKCVVITKLPFAVPSEPIVEARMELLAAQGKDPFTHYQIPRAAILLKQGFGRLIRRGTDRGIVAILDPRLKTRRYGREFLKSLPECRMASDFAEMKRLLNSEETAHNKDTLSVQGEMCSCSDI